MDGKETNFLTPILSAITGIATLATVLSPIFVSSDLFRPVIVNVSSLKFLSVIGFLVSILVLWFFVSPNAYSVMNSGKNPGKVRFWGILLFLFVCMIFYLTKLLFDGKMFSALFADIVQSVAYVLAFGILSAVIGMLFKDTYNQYQWNSKNSRISQTVREAVLDSGYIEVDLKIIAMNQHILGANDPMDYINSYDVVFGTKGSVYHAIIAPEQKTLLLCEKLTVPKAENSTNRASKSTVRRKA